MPVNDFVLGGNRPIGYYIRPVAAAACVFVVLEAELAFNDWAEFVLWLQGRAFLC